MIQRMSKPVQAVAVTLLLLMTSPLLAQVPAEPGPPRATAPYAAYSFALILIGGVLAAAFKNSKRTHQD